jgi:hypothetical protein
MRTAIEWLVGKVKGSTTGCRTVRSLQLSKQHTLCKMAYSVEELVFIVKTFYQTSSFVTVQRQFQRKFNMQQAPVSSASCLVQKFELTGCVCNNSKGVVGRQGQHAHRTVLLLYAKCCFGVWEYLWHDVPSHSVSKEHQHLPSCDGIWHILTKFKWYRCFLQPTSSGDMSSVGTS